MPTWLPLPPEILPFLEALAVLSLGMFVAAVFLVPIFIARIPARYYVDLPRRPTDWGRRHPALRILLLAGRNALGWVLVVAGIAMLALPGQGLLALLVGLTLVDVPQKRRVELWLIRRGPVLRSLNWIRHKARKAPLELPDDG